MTPRARASRSYNGTAPEPVEWSVLDEIFVAIFGREARSLKTYPATLQSVWARWLDADRVEHTATTLSEVAGAYSREETYPVTFSGRSKHGEMCSFEYWPGGEPRARLIVQGPPDEVDPMIAPVRAAFPFQRSVLFISWSRSRGRRVAEALRDLVKPRMPPAGEVFISPDIPPGANPQKVMIDQNLSATDAHIAVVTREAAKSHWVTWEVASSWARQKTVIPLFVGVHPNEIEGPLTLLIQGVELEDATQLTRAIKELVSAVGGNVETPLSEEEVALLQSAAE
jgi:TIR domain